MKQCVCFFLILLWGLSAMADETSYQFSSTFESRHFFLHRDNYPTNHAQILKTDFRFIYDNQSFLRFKAHPRIKLDFADHDNNRFIPVESYLEFYRPHHTWQIGINQTHWGVATLFNPTDILNRRDFESNYYNPEKLGEIFLTYKGHVGEVGLIDDLTLSLFILPVFFEAPLPKLDTRFQIQGQAGLIPYTLADIQDTPDFIHSLGTALRIEATVDPVDVTLTYYHGPERSPAFQLWIDSGGRLRLLPYYYTVDMLGLDLLFQTKNWEFFLESAVKITALNGPRKHEVRYEDGESLPQSYVQFVPGISYTFQNKGAGTLKIVGEYWGELNPKRSLRTFRPFQSDVFFGAFYDLNNRHQTTFMLGLVKDVTQNEAALQFEVSSKIYKELQWKLGGLWVHRDGASNTPLSFFENNSSVYSQLSVTWGKKN